MLDINIIQVDSDGALYADGGKYANEVLLFSVNPKEYTGKKVLAALRCCQRKNGTQDRMRIDSEVSERNGQSGNSRKDDTIIQNAKYEARQTLQ